MSEVPSCNYKALRSALHQLLQKQTALSPAAYIDRVCQQAQVTNGSGGKNTEQRAVALIATARRVSAAYTEVCEKGIEHLANENTLGTVLLGTATMTALLESLRSSQGSKAEHESKSSSATDDNLQNLETIEETLTLISTSLHMGSFKDDTIRRCQRLIFRMLLVIATATKVTEWMSLQASHLKELDEVISTAGSHDEIRKMLQQIHNQIADVIEVYNIYGLFQEKAAELVDICLRLGQAVVKTLPEVKPQGYLDGLWCCGVDSS